MKKQKPVSNKMSQLHQAGSESPQALEGLRVLDLSFYAPGRCASMVLADLGADVICVEMPRGLRPEESLLDDDQSVRWLLYQRNKRSMTLNLKSAEGQQIVDDLAKNVDVVIESYKPGTAEKLGVGYDRISAIAPHVVYCSVSGFGQTGPYRDLIGHETNYQGLGLALGQNRPTGSSPIPLSALVGDIGGGANFAIIAILSALLHRERTGKGQYIDVSISAGILPLMGALPYAQWMKDPFRSVHFSSGLRADFRAYETSDGKYVAVSPSEPWLWKRFCAAIERNDLVERKPEDLASRREQEALVEELGQVFKSRTQAEWVEINSRANVAITPVLENIEEVEQDLQVIHRGQIKEVDYEPLGRVKQIGLPFTMSATPPEVRWIPTYGEHTDEILGELGFSTDEVVALRESGVCESPQEVDTQP